MSEGRMNDQDVLGPPRSCKPLPGWLWVTWVVALLVLAVVAIALKEIL